MSAEGTTGTSVSQETLTIDFRPYQHAAQIAVAFTDTERHLEAMRGER